VFGATVFNLGIEIMKLVLKESDRQALRRILNAIETALDKYEQAIERLERGEPLSFDASLLQDIDDTAPNYSAGLSGRLGNG
jgi:hypothetical protein